MNSSVLGFHNHLFKLNTGYELTDSLRAYATYSEGFRHGGTKASSIGVCAFCDSPSTASSARGGDALPYVGYTRPLVPCVTLDLHADALYRSDVTTQINSTASGYERLGEAGPVLKNANLYPNYRVDYLMRPRTVGLSLAYTVD